MNADHADAIQLYANRLLGRAGDAWRMTGIDPDGCDLRQGSETARLPFDGFDRAMRAGARAELVAMVRKARADGSRMSGIESNELGQMGEVQVNIVNDGRAGSGSAACSRGCARDACCAICCRRRWSPRRCAARRPVLSADGALVATTGRFTGRSPKDKYFVAYPELAGRDRLGHRQPAARGTRASPACCAGRVDHVDWRELFAQDLYAGADPAHRLKVRVITEQAWHSLFARNMFIRPSAAELAGFEPDWTVLQLPSLEADPAVDGTNSSTVIAIDFARAPRADRRHRLCRRDQEVDLHRPQLPPAGRRRDADALLRQCRRRTVARRCSSACPAPARPRSRPTADRTLIGDDEHGWGPEGVFNFEGGCYAKVIRLDPAAEPEIYAASTRFGSMLENVVLDAARGCRASTTTA